MSLMSVYIVTIASVSYTHLDVYKRQGMNNTVSEFINSALDTSKNNVINATNQEIVINQNGLRGRNQSDNGDYSPNQVWLTSNTLAFTSNNWQTAGLALGQINLNGQNVFGLVADAIVGKLIAGNQLQITNDNNNFILDSNGAVLNNASFTIVSDNGKSQIKLNPTDGISIQTRPNTSSNWANQFYVCLLYTSGFEQLLGMVGAVSEASRRSASVVGNSFKTIFSRLTNVAAGKMTDDLGEPLNDVEQVFNGLNIKLRDSSGEFRNMYDVISELANKWTKLDNVEQNWVATSVAGTRQRETFLTLMENWDRAVTLSTTALNSEGMAMDKMSIYLESIEANLNKLKAAVEDLLYSEEIVNVINLVIKAITRLVEGISWLIDKLGGCLLYTSRCV